MNPGPPPPPDRPSLTAHISRMRRLWWDVGRGARSVEVPPDAGTARVGWISPDPATDNAFPSRCPNRAWLIGAPRPPSIQEVDRALDIFRREGIAHAFLFCEDPDFPTRVHEHLLSRACTPWDGAQSFVLTRQAAAFTPRPLPEDYEIRTIAPDEAALLAAGPLKWYGDPDPLVRCVRSPGVTMFGVFAGGQAVAAALVNLDPPFAYLNAAGTDPAHRGRGCQSALIAARVRHAAAHGAALCTAETNQAVPISLANFLRAGFAIALTHRIYEWRAAP